MHNPQAFLPVENSAAPAVQCLVWAVLPLLYIYNKKQGRSTTVLALSVKACRLCQLSPQRRRFRRKQAQQMPFAFTTPPVKMAYRSVRRRSGMPKI